MGYIENVATYYVRRSHDLEQMLQDARDKVSSGGFGLDDLLSANLKLWMNAIDDLSSLYAHGASPDTVPVLFATLSPTTTDYEGLVTVARVPADVTLIPTKILPLYGSGEVDANDVFPQLQSDGTLKVTIANCGALSSGGVFQGVVYYSRTGGALQPVALILLYKM